MKTKSVYNEADLFVHFWKGHTDKADNGYATFYEKIFAEKHPKSILEIGIRAGGSLLSWKSLFPDARIVGVDISPPHKIIQKEYARLGIEWYLVDATTPDLLTAIGDGKFDLIVDDGSHFYKHQMQSFDLLKNRFNHYYVIEDVRWQHDMIKSYIENDGYKVDNFQCEFQPYVTVNKKFLEDNEGTYICHLTNRRVSNLWDPLGEQVTTEMQFYMIKQKGS